MKIKKLKYGFLDIKHNLRNYIIFLIQMIFVILIVNFSIKQILNIKEGLNRISNLRNSESYIVVDITPDDKVDKILNSDRENSIRKLKGLWNKIKSLQCKNQYTIYSYPIGIDKHGTSLEQKIATIHFFDIYQIKVNEGRDFSVLDYESITDIVTIIIGFNLSRYYKLNQIYSLKNGITGKDINCKVIGILPKNTNYPILSDLSNVKKLDDSYIMPMSDHMVENDFQIPDFDMALSGTVITTENKSDLDDIVAEANRINLFLIRFENVKDTISKYIDYITPGLKYQLITAAIILVFACVSMISHLSAMIVRQRKDYTAHVLCGARFSDIVLRLCVQVAFLLALAIIPCVLFMGFSKSLFLTFIIEIVTMATVIFFPIVKLHSQSVTQIRRSE